MRSSMNLVTPTLRVSPELRVALKALKCYQPPPRFTISEWADEKRRLSPESSAEPGQWHTARAEYQRGMMDAFNEPQVEMVTLMTSSQVGKTEMVNNIIGYY